VKGYSDLYELEEADRVRIISEAVLAGNTVGVAVDDDDEKVARYIEKLEGQGCRHIETDPGPCHGVIMLRFGPPLDS